MAGAELQLNAINALLHDAFIRELPGWTSILLIVAAAAGSWVLTMSLGTMWLRLAAYVFSGLAYLLLVKLAYDEAGIVLLAMPPLFTFGTAGLISLIYDYTRETLEKLRIRHTLETYVSKEVVREVVDNPTGYLSSLGGKRTQVAAIVTDLRGFTTMAECMESTQLVSQLNEYLSHMVSDIFAVRGSVINFKADAILAALDPAIRVRFVDFHAEVTSEKTAMGWYLDGRVSAVIGTHTHIPTADTRILPAGTAYQTDCGMTGSYNSVIGVDRDITRCQRGSGGCLAPS